MSGIFFVGEKTEEGRSGAVHATYDIHPLRVASREMVNYCYVIADRSSGLAAVVDPAWDAEAIVEKLSETGAVPRLILLTHSHHDHVNRAEELARRFDAQVCMTAREIERYGFRCSNLHALQDLDTVMLGETPITCLLTPGHTAGGACFLLADALFTGDTIFIEGCGICDSPGGSPEQMFESVQKIKRVVEPHVRVYPGHSYGEPPGRPLSYLLQNNIYFLLDRQEHFVTFRMRKNQQNLLGFK